ncbi:hypothetical protein FHX73_12597 [Kitasatospora viridis]|uniref:Uncharacterized protein n=1 Tax=Kitasatospora viridis TaxID=281105 RepID=A0A561TWK2_9ACTN|nr:hypothetical protein FHX73_12597 [Kitasatospora viridis]
MGGFEEADILDTDHNPLYGSALRAGCAPS